MSCSLCHAETGHKPTCVQVLGKYAVEWKHVRPDSAWEVLSRALFDAWIGKTSEGTDDVHLNSLRHSLEDGDAYTATQHLRKYMEGKG